MGILQDEFDRVLKEQLTTPNLMRGVLRRALKAQGVESTETDLDAIVMAIDQSSEDADSVSFQLESHDADDADARLVLDAEELTAALKQLKDDIAGGIDATIRSVIADAGPAVLSTLYADAPSALRRHRSERRGFEKRLYKRWKQGLDRLEMLLMIAQEAGATFLEDVRRATKTSDSDKAEDDVLVLDALIRLHTRACRIASEVLCLLRGGFADGANARWRSLHETAVISLFIAEHGAAVAERYLDHSGVDRYRAAQQYQEHCEALGEEPIISAELDDLRREHDALLAKYGPSFKHGYGWAAEAIGQSRPTFVEIERALDMSRWRPYYKMACHSVHAGPQGLYFSLSAPTGEMLLAGPSNAGLCDPGHCTAISLTMVSVAAITTQPNLDGLVALTVMLRLCDDIGEALLESHRIIDELAQMEDGESDPT